MHWLMNTYIRVLYLLMQRGNQNWFGDVYLKKSYCMDTLPLHAFTIQWRTAEGEPKDKPLLADAD